VQQPLLLINRTFALLWGGQAISSMGDVLYDTTLVLWLAFVLARGRPWAPLAVSGMLLVTASAQVTLRPLAGVFVDRWDKRRTMLWMDGARAILIALLLLATNSFPLPFLPGGHLPLAGQLAATYTVVFLASLCSQLFSPARMALIGDVVPEPYLAQASSLSQITQSLAIVIAPPLAPILLLTVGPQIALLFNAASFAFSYLMILAMRAPKAASSLEAGKRPSFLREFAAGLQFSVQNRVILTLLVTVSVVMLGASALNALDIFFVRNNLHTSTTLYGFLTTAQGAGAILGAILAGMFIKQIGLTRMLVGSLLLLGVGMLIFARLTSFVPALIFCFVAGIFTATLNVPVGPLLLRVTPRALIGRVSATLNPTSAMMQVLGTTIAGFLASNLLLNFHAQAFGLAFGPIDTIYTGGALLVLIGSVYALLRLGFTDPAPVVEAQPAPAAEPAMPLMEAAIIE
jgi:MFS family permease